MPNKNWIDKFNKFSPKRNIEEAKIPFKNQVYIAFLVNLIIISFVFTLLWKLPPQIPLFYGLPEGEGQLAPDWALIIPNSTSLLILVLNILIANSIKDDFYKKILIIGAIVSTFFASITTLKIFFLIGSIF